MTRTSARAAWLLVLPELAVGARAQEAAPAPASLPSVTVTGKRGTAAYDYRVDSLDALGPLGHLKVMDAPYSIGILPLDLIENSQARNFKEASRYLPLVSYQEQQGPQILRPQTRGMQGGNFQNSRLDGMTLFVTVANAIEQYQQIEVLNGVSSALYGPANPSGMFNFVSKRPTEAPMRRVTFAYDSHSLFTEQLDLGGKLDRDGVLAYRIGALAADGGGYVDGSVLRRDLGSFAFDVRPDRDTVIETNFSDYKLKQKGYPGWFTYGQSIELPAAPDPTRVGYGQSFAGVDMETTTTSARLLHDFDSHWHLVAGLLNQYARRDIDTPVDNLTSSSGNYTSSLATGFAPHFSITSDMAYLNGNFEALGMAHDLTIGTAGYAAASYSARQAATAASVLLGSASLATPKVFPLPPGGLPNTAVDFNSSTVYQQGMNIGDTVTLDPRWSARAALSSDTVTISNFAASGTRLPGYDASGLSPTASLMYKPRSDVTTYLTYASSLQAGDLAPGTAANANVGLAPYRSKQYEAGVKVALARIDLTAALFRIERPFANVDPSDNTFKVVGNQVNDGLELSAVGELVDRVTVYGGLTLLDARLKGTGNAATDDKRFVGNPRAKGSLLLEYRVPRTEGLVASVDWQYSGNRPGNDVNSFEVAGYSVFDLATRYATRIAGTKVTWRLAVDNVLDRDYWSTVAPSNITGANTGNLVAHLGSPRTLAASMTLDF